MNEKPCENLIINTPFCDQEVFTISDFVATKKLVKLKTETLKADIEIIIVDSAYNSSTTKCGEIKSYSTTFKINLILNSDTIYISKRSVISDEQYLKEDVMNRIRKPTEIRKIKMTNYDLFIINFDILIGRERLCVENRYVIVENVTQVKKIIKLKYLK